MTMYRSKEGLILIDVIQFDPASQIAIGIKRWPDEAGYQPGDMSWGYLDTDTGREHVHAGDWIARDREGNLYVYTNEIFRMNFALYREAPKMATIPDVTVHMDITPEGQAWIAQLQEAASQLSEDRIRAIVREEIEARAKQQVTNARVGYPTTYWPGHEVK